MTHGEKWCHHASVCCMLNGVTMGTLSCSKIRARDKAKSSVVLGRAHFLSRYGGFIGSMREAPRMKTFVLIEPLLMRGAPRSPFSVVFWSFYTLQLEPPKSEGWWSQQIYCNPLQHVSTLTIPHHT